MDDIYIIDDLPQEPIRPPRQPSLVPNVTTLIVIIITLYYYFRS